MPQHIPLEATGNGSSFTPECLKHLPDAPSFTLRVSTWREKEYRLRLHAEEGILVHDDAEVRAETLRGLKAMWTEDQFTEYGGFIEAYWEAADNFAQQRKDDPDLVWEYDPDMERSIVELLGKIQRDWRPLAVMAADNRQYARLEPVFYIATLVKDWTGLKAAKALDRGYLSIDCAMALVEALHGYSTRNGVEPGLAAGELYLACLRAMYLDEDEVGNSASPSPSKPSPLPSTEKTTSAKAGKSPASARSGKTRKAV